LAGRHVLVTAGPTHEPIDPVRFIGNRSSGLQGYAIARAARAAGARVTLVSGPTALAAPQGVEVVAVETAIEMLAAVEAALPADIFIAAAAVADWRVESAGAHKLKKNAQGPPFFNLVENPDILATVSQRESGRPRLVVGFAAETRDVVENARKKLYSKNCDLIVANDVGEAAGVFGGSENEVYLIAREEVHSWPRMSKDDVASKLVRFLGECLGK
jgi:phosphopantothenoylcysteine decarboxylase/phosphopantothenate--cysteine ligase